MKNQILKSIILSSLISTIITNFNYPVFAQNESKNISSSPNFQGLLTDIENSYDNFENDNKFLLKKLEEESKKDPPTTDIEGIDTKIKENYDKLVASVNNLKNQLSEEEKRELNNLLSPLQTEKEKGLSVEAFTKLLEDGRLDKTEICESIQIPLGLFLSKNDANCGNFNNKTYGKLSGFINTQIEAIDKEIKTVEKLPRFGNNSEETSGQNNSSQEDNSSFLILWIVNLIIALGLIGAFIGIYLLNKKIEKENHKLYNHIEKTENKIEELSERNQNQSKQVTKQDAQIKNLKNKNDSLQKEIENLTSQINNILLKVNPLEKQYITHQTQPQNEIITDENNELKPELEEQTKSEPEPEYVRLARSYQKNPHNLVQNAIRVSMTKETLNKILAGTWEGIVELEENNRQGEFYIVNNNSGQFYLFLDPDTKFNVPTLQNINKSQLFICKGNMSQGFKGNEIHIIKPAVVQENNNNWRLAESGEIQLS
ncbi:hypothetical protein H6G11_17275 [Cyanobacterium aponinum FACHB-4101]|uniref:hypothetical protein n=1 Tax=Cyanobacterium aponinum TaxID=379064 RepID=UPI00168130BA|nr:hypothetical protein [Cyanobacterium aponinum]MBD2395999.1 hypothetical protein [Cyanobacterium aponinum FACHB-4101]